MTNYPAYYTFLIRFFKCKTHVDMFREGKLFAQTLEYFRKLENKTGQSDHFEGSVYSGDVEIEPAKLCDFVNVVCFHELMFGLYNISKPKHSLKSVPLIDASKEFTLPINAQLPCEFGNHMVIIPNKLKFIMQVRDSLLHDDEISTFHIGPISYFDDRPTWNELASKLTPAFFKRECLNYQKEFRIAFWRKNLSRSPHVFDVGDLKHYAIYHHASEPFIMRCVPN